MVSRPIATAFQLALGLLLCGVAAPAAGASFDYVYVEANEGGSSGGHSAIRFGERTYHFENRDGLLVLDRETTSDFFHSYALLGNRTIELHRVALSDADLTRALGRFRSRHHAQERQLDVQAALREDRERLEAWHRGESGAGIPALGYFRQGGPPSRSVARVSRAIEARHRTGFLSSRHAEAAAAFASARAGDPVAWRIEYPKGIDQLPSFQLGFARRIDGRGATLGALWVLEHRAGLAADATIRPEGPSWWLTAEEITQLERSARALEDELIRLAASERPDWGKPFLVGLARLLAMEESLEARRFVFLDTLPDDARRLGGSLLASRPGVVAQMIRAGHSQAEAARAGWASAEVPGERAWVRIESTANRVHELESAARERRDLRVSRGVLVPSRRAPLRDGAAAPPRDDLARQIESASAREAGYRDALEDLYRYQLITRNCVSELFHTLNEAVGGSASGSEAALGGYIDGHTDLAFVPFLSAAAVDREYRVSRRHTLPSWRELQIQEMKRHEPVWWVALRESNTLTARSYRAGHEDSWFVFFTDDALPLRPVFGSVNLLAGLTESLWGIAKLPFDGGTTLASGVQGSLASLPELFFWNIRKGSNDWVARRDQERLGSERTPSD